MARRRTRRPGLNGLGSVRRLFKQLPKEFSEDIAGALNKYAALIEDTAEAEVPVRSGSVKENISFRKARAGRLSVDVGIRGKRARRRAFNAIFVFKGRRAYFRGFSVIDGVPANPVLQRALAQFAPRAVAEIEDEVRKSIVRAVRAGVLKR